MSHRYVSSIASVALAAVLGGCNVVTGPRAAFGQRLGVEGGTTPVLRTGSWHVCMMDPTKTDCAPADRTRFTVSATTLDLVPLTPKANGDRDYTLRYALFDTSPMLMEVDSPAGLVPVFDWMSQRFAFTTIAPLSRDDSGRITRFEFRPVLCGPAKKAWFDMYLDDPHAPYVTRKPLKGMTMTGENCSARDTASILPAAKSSMQGKPFVAAWLSDTP